MSIVAALSEWLIHTNRRDGGAWTQRYEAGVPVTDLLAIEGNGTTGTTVHFLPGPAMRRQGRITSARVCGAAARFAHLNVTVASRLCLPVEDAVRTTHDR
jgi:DNA gyrase subunit B